MVLMYVNTMITIGHTYICTGVVDSIKDYQLDKAL